MGKAIDAHLDKKTMMNNEELVEAVAREMYMDTLRSSYQVTWSLLPDCPIKQASYDRAKIAVQVIQDFNSGAIL